MAYRPPNPGWGAAATWAKKNRNQPGAWTGGSRSFYDQFAPKGPVDLNIPSGPFFGPGVGGAQGGGGNPYQGILDEFLSSTKSRFAGQSAQDAAARDAQIRRYLISYGDVPDFDALGISDQTRGFLSGALNDKVRDLAAKNTAEGTSVKARMQKADKVARRRIPATLAGRGILRSGQTGSDLADQAQAYKNQQFDTLNEMLGGVEGTIGSFLQAERARADALAAAEMQARMMAMQNYGGYMYGDQGVPGAGPGGARSGATRTTTPNPQRGYGGVRPVRQGSSVVQTNSRQGFRPF